MHFPEHLDFSPNIFRLIPYNSQQHLFNTIQLSIIGISFPAFDSHSVLSLVAVVIGSVIDYYHSSYVSTDSVEIFGHTVFETNCVLSIEDVVDSLEVFDGLFCVFLEGCGKNYYLEVLAELVYELDCSRTDQDGAFLLGLAVKTGFKRFSNRMDQSLV